MTQTLKLSKIFGAWLLLTLLFGNGPFMSLERLHAAPQVQAGSARLVDINKAGFEELQAVRGIGPALAERIVQYRDEHGRFEKPDDIANVRGIGGAKLQKIKKQISL